MLQLHSTRKYRLNARGRRSSTRRRYNDEQRGSI